MNAGRFPDCSKWFERPVLALPEDRNGSTAGEGNSRAAREVTKLKGPATQLVDLKGRTLLPASVDAHGHMMMGGLQALSGDVASP